ncbi:MAG: DUF262 domain-containing protein [Deltaproteobacteria bacterium]|nr:DUF262 domain-containing protein [Candidatus Zymogenaceae bacterium]
MKFLDANEISILQLLSDQSKAYRVPLYQRPYVWNDEQWQELLDDLTNLTDSDVHFLGSFVVVPDDVTDTNIDTFQVVDGQQRLATILIWLAALKDIFQRRGEDKVADFISDYFSIDQVRGGERTTQPKLILSTYDDEVFSSILRGKIPDDPTNLLVRCYHYFRDESLRYGDLEDLYTKLLNRVSVVHINVFSHLNAFRLFETLNDRGLELSSADLIKNFILMKVAEDRETFDLVISRLNDMYDRLRDRDPVTFFRRYILSRFRGKVSEARVYERIRHIIESLSVEDVRDFAVDLSEKALLYEKILDGTTKSADVNRRLRNLNFIKAFAAHSLLLLVLEAFEETDALSEEDVSCILGDIETFHIRWAVCNRFAGNLDKMYNDLCVVLGSEAPDRFRAFIREFLTRLLEENRVTDEIFENDFISRHFNPNEPKTKYILHRLTTPTVPVSNGVDYRSVHTEHIMPKRLTNQWRDYLKRTGRSDDEIAMLHREYHNRIGNLTLIKGEWYLKYSNKMFNEKITEHHYRDCEFDITKKLVENGGEWSFERIENRSEELFEIVRRHNLWRMD